MFCIFYPKVVTRYRTIAGGLTRRLVYDILWDNLISDQRGVLWQSNVLFDKMRRCMMAKKVVKKPPVKTTAKARPVSAPAPALSPADSTSKLPDWLLVLIGLMVALIVLAFVVAVLPNKKTEETEDSTTTEQPAEESEATQLKKENQKLKKELAECLKEQPSVSPSMLSGGMATKSQPTVKPEPENVPSGKLMVEVNGEAGAYIGGPIVLGQHAFRSRVDEPRQYAQSELDALGERVAVLERREPSANP